MAALADADQPGVGVRDVDRAGGGLVVVRQDVLEPSRRQSCCQSAGIPSPVLLKQVGQRERGRSRLRSTAHWLLEPLVDPALNVVHLDVRDFHHWTVGGEWVPCTARPTVCG